MSADLFANNILFVSRISSKYRNIFSNFSSECNLDVVTSYEECFLYLKIKKVAVVIVESEITDMDGIDLLFIIKGRYPNIKRVLLTDNLGVKKAIEGINIAQLNLIIDPNDSSEGMNSKISTLIYEFNNYQKNLDLKLLENSTKARQSYEVKSDDLLDLLFNLYESGHIRDFTNQFMGVLEGMKSLMSLNAEVYLGNKDSQILKKIILQTSDIEVFANQFNQKIILLYIMTIRSYLYILDNDYENSKINFTGVQLVFDWLKSENIASSLIDCINVFPINFNAEDEEGSNEMIHIQPPVVNFVETQLRKLFSLDLALLVNISDETLRYHIEKQSNIQYFMILRKDLPVYEKIAKNSDVNSHLISAFIIALSSFLEEVIKTSGDIETISHNNGVILFYRVDDLQYILLSNTNDVRLRIALRQIAFETKKMVIEIPDNNTVSEDEREIINGKSDEILGEY